MVDTFNLGFTWYVHGTEKLRIGGKTIPVVLKIIPVVLVVVGRLVHNEPNSIVRLPSILQVVIIFEFAPAKYK